MQNDNNTPAFGIQMKKYKYKEQEKQRIYISVRVLFSRLGEYRWPRIVQKEVVKAYPIIELFSQGLTRVLTVEGFTLFL